MRRWLQKEKRTGTPKSFEVEIVSQGTGNWRVRLTIGHQSFDMCYYPVSEREAEWMAEELRVALNRIVPGEKHE
jgi:hypothetical protein